MFLLSNSLGGISTDVFFQEVPNLEVKGPDVGCERTIIHRASQAHVPLTAAFIPVIPVNSQGWAPAPLPSEVIRHIDHFYGALYPDAT